MNQRWIPRTVALELTLACPHRCATCGSDAGRPRANELTQVEWQEVIDDLAQLGTRRLALMGGEPLQVPGWDALAARGISHGMDVEMVTSAIGLDEGVADRMASLPLYSVTVSVDGTERIHDQLRGMPGAYRSVLRAISQLDGRGIPVGVTTQVNQANLALLEAMAAQLQDAGILAWQIQLTLPTGRAKSTELALTPANMLVLHATLERMLRRRGLRPHLTDSIGWFAPDDVRMRTPQGMPNRAWVGCQAGTGALGITSDGRIKGCLAMPDPNDEGNVRSERLSDVWHDPARFAYNRCFAPALLTAACASCEFGKLCRGGCTASAMAFCARPNTSQHCLRALLEASQARKREDAP